MAYIGDTGVDLTTSEVEMIESLVALANSGSAQAIQKTGATTFDNLGVWITGLGTGATLTVSATEPPNPQENDLWFDIS